MAPGRTPTQPREAFKADVLRWAAKVGVTPKQVRIQRMTRKWASCSRLGRLTFNAALLRKPRRFRQYVMAHEVLHLKVPNHGSLFKSLLKAYAPEFIPQEGDAPFADVEFRRSSFHASRRRRRALAEHSKEDAGQAPS